MLSCVHCFQDTAGLRRCPHRTQRGPFAAPSLPWASDCWAGPIAKGSEEAQPRTFFSSPSTLPTSLSILSPNLNTIRDSRHTSSAPPSLGLPHTQPYRPHLHWTKIVLSTTSAGRTEFLPRCALLTQSLLPAPSSGKAPARPVARVTQSESPSSATAQPVSEQVLSVATSRHGLCTCASGPPARWPSRH